jgi:hypothetical protein
MNATLWDTQKLTVKPSGHGKNYRVDAEAPGGEPLASVEDGKVRDASGAVLLEAPVRWGKSGKRFSVDLVGPDGHVIGQATPTKTSTGPRKTKAAVAVTDESGAEVLRAQPDKHGEQVVVARDDTPLARIDITTVKSGFMRKSRVYEVTVEDGVPNELRPLVVGLALRYDAVLNAVKAAAAD